MNILIANISLRPEAKTRFPPLGLGYIVTAINSAGYDYDLLDIDVNRLGHEAVEQQLQKKEYDLVLIGCIVTGYKIIKDLCERIKTASPNTKIIVGNTVASSIPKHLLLNSKADIVVVGEGDITIIELIKLLDEGKTLEKCEGIAYLDGTEVVITNPREPIADLDSLPLIDWDLFEVEKYIQQYRNSIDESIPLPQDEIRPFSLSAARGCIHRCSFCYHAFQGYPYRRRSNQNIIDEIQLMISKYGINTIQFNDDLTFYSKPNLDDFVTQIEERGMKFYWRGTCCANLFQKDEDVELAVRMREAGCTSLGFSLESSNLEILKMMRKHHTPEQFLKRAEILQKAGIVCLTSLVFGYPNETEETIRKTLDCCIEAKIYPSSGFLLPQPGSWAFEYAVEHGHITDFEEYYLALGDRQDLRINLTQLSDEQLQGEVEAGLKRCNKALRVGLDEDSLIKTGKYRKAKLD